MTNSITNNDVKKLARLACIKVEDENIDFYITELNKIIELISKIQNIDTKHVKPMAHPLGVKLTLREDKVTEIIDNKQLQALQKLAPKTKDNLYLSPPIIFEIDN